MIEGIEGVSISKIYRELSSDALIVQSFEEGSFVDEIAKIWDQKKKNKAGSILLNVFFNNLFKDGFLQGDCNIGNYLFRASETGEPEVVFIDFGNCLEVEKSSSTALWKLINLVRKNEELDNGLNLLVQLGFSREKLLPIETKLPELLHVIFEPFIEQEAYDLSKWKIKERVDQILSDQKWCFGWQEAPTFSDQKLGSQFT